MQNRFSGLPVHCTASSGFPSYHVSLSSGDTPRKSALVCVVVYSAPCDGQFMHLPCGTQHPHEKAFIEAKFIHFWPADGRRIPKQVDWHTVLTLL